RLRLRDPFDLEAGVTTPARARRPADEDVVAVLVDCQAELEGVHTPGLADDRGLPRQVRGRRETEGGRVAGPAEGRRRVGAAGGPWTRRRSTPRCWPRFQDPRSVLTVSLSFTRGGAETRCGACSSRGGNTRPVWETGCSPSGTSRPRCRCRRPR